MPSTEHPRPSRPRRGGQNRRADVPASRIIHVRVTPAEEAELHAVADARDMRPAEVIRGWIQRRDSMDALVEELDALVERADPKEIEAVAEILSEARARLHQTRGPEIILRRAG